MLVYRECNLSEIVPPGCDANDVGADDPTPSSTMTVAPWWILSSLPVMISFLIQCLGVFV